MSLTTAPESRIFLTYNQKAPAAPQIALETSAELLESSVRLLSVADRKLAGRTATDLEFETIENLRRVGQYLETNATFSPEAQRTHTNQLVQGVREIEAAYHARLLLRPAEVINGFLLTTDNALMPFLKSLTSENVLRVQVDPNLSQTGVVNEVDEHGRRSVVLSFRDENLNSLPRGIASTVQSLAAASLTHGKGTPKESDVRIQTLRILDQLLDGFEKKYGPRSDLLPVLTEARQLIEANALMR